MPIAFVEERFNTEFRYGLVGGPTFSTTIVETSSGVEEVNINWTESLSQWTTAQDSYNRDEIDLLIRFFNARQGRAVGFRFKAWEDFEATQDQGIFKAVTGGMQAYKRYISPGVYLAPGTTYYKDKIIQKPVRDGASLPFNVYTAAGVLVPRASYAVDWSTGIVSGGGIDATFKWEGEFDRPARFTTDKFDCEFLGFRESDGERLFQVTGLGIREIRLPMPTLL